MCNSKQKLWLHIICTAAFNLSINSGSVLKWGHFEVALQLLKAIFQFLLVLTESMTVFFFLTTSNDQNCKSNQLYLF